MKKNLIKKLAVQSYSNDNLNPQVIERVAKILKREDLKVYIKNLKTLENKKTVIVTVPNEEGIDDIKKYFEKIYPNKKILFQEDPSLLTGIRVIDYDNIYELSLKSFLESAIGRTTND